MSEFAIPPETMTAIFIALAETTAAIMAALTLAFRLCR